MLQKSAATPAPSVVMKRLRACQAAMFPGKNLE